MEKYTKLKSLGDGQMHELKSIIARPDIRYRVGCDSMNIKNHSVYITSLVGIYPNDRGAFVFFHKEKIPKVKNIHERLWKEAEIAVAFAKFLREELEADIEAIDFDFNIDPQYPSSRLSAPAIGWANAEGFEAFCKPDKLYAIWASDHIVHGHKKIYESRRHDGK